MGTESQAEKTAGINRADFDDATPSLHTSDTESILSREGHSDCEGDLDPVLTADPPLPAIAVQLERFSASFDWLASVDLESLFAKRSQGL